ncbi:hypothetical protein GGR56DRAFT_127108 [Xylariaceae sp. FL0804]|nr:hypothetical protein GGR56DRAFT_127108 [Xylariaceae sp. FL0804]
MRVSVVAVLTFALGAYAMPSASAVEERQIGGLDNIPRPPSDTTIGQAGSTCGRDMQLSCCNNVRQDGDSVDEAQGILAGALQGVLQDGTVGLFDGCSKLSVTALIGVNDLLNQQCKQTAACCQDSGDEQEGLVNLGLPCVALGSVL